MYIIKNNTIYLFIYIIFSMFAFNMKKRVINILNKNKQRRTFKFLPEDGGILVYAEDPIKSIKYDEKEENKIIELTYKDGPILSTGNKIEFKNRGQYKIIDIYNYISTEFDCYFLDVLKIR